MVLADDTVWIALSAIMQTVIVTGGAIAVAVISNRQKANKRTVDAVHEQLKTSNGKSVGTYVEEIAQSKDA